VPLARLIVPADGGGRGGHAGTSSSPDRGQTRSRHGGAAATLPGAHREGEGEDWEGKKGGGRRGRKARVSSAAPQRAYIGERAGGREEEVDGDAPPCCVRREEGEDGKQDGDDGVSVRSGTGQGELVGPRVGWEEKEKGDPGWACSG
jgi:hypothetical protein